MTTRTARWLRTTRLPLVVMLVVACVPQTTPTGGDETTTTLSHPPMIVTGGGDAGFDELTAAVELAEECWVRAAVTNYDMAFSYNPQLDGLTVEVRAGVPVSVPPKTDLGASTVEGMFSEIRRLARRKPFSLSVRFDQELCYPSRIVQSQFSDAEDDDSQVALEIILR